MKRLTALILISCLVMGGCANGQAPVVTPETTGQVRDWDYAETTAFGKYPKLVKYTLGKMTGLNNSNMPDGDTYENNAYTRYLKNKLNIQNKDQFEINESDNYTEAVSMAITAKELPDVMVLDWQQIETEPMWKKRSTITRGETIRLVIEIVSTDWQDDYLIKLAEYEKLAIPEYWIVDYAQRKLLVYFFESEACPVIYGLDQPVPVGIYHGELTIDFSNILKWIEKDLV